MTKAINYFKNITFGAKNIFVNIFLFSLIGIVSITNSNFISAFTVTSYFGYPLNNNFYISLNIFIGLILSIYLYGYLYTYSNFIYKNGSSTLPEPKLDSYTVFVKMLPVFLVWGFYFFMLLILGVLLFRLGSLYSYIYYFLIVLCFPFINIIFIIYSRHFKCKPLLLNPLLLIKIISKYLRSVFLFAVTTLPFLGILIYIFTKGFYFTDRITNTSLQVGLRIFLLSAINYIIYIYQILFIQVFGKKS